MNRRKFVSIASVTAILATLGCFGFKSKQKLRRVLKITTLKDRKNLIMGIHEDKIQSEYKEIEFKELEKGDTFFLESSIQTKGASTIFEGPYITASDVFLDRSTYGVMVQP